jgi:hypothetical protein
MANLSKTLSSVMLVKATYPYSQKFGIKYECMAVTNTLGYLSKVLNYTKTLSFTRF